MGDRRDILRLLLPSLDLDAADAGVGDALEMLGGRKILRRDEVAAIELGTVGLVVQDVVLAAGLGAGATVGAPLGDHPRHVALAGIGDAERAVDEALEAQTRHRLTDGLDVLEGVLSRGTARTV